MDDLISRQAAIDALHVYFKDGFSEDKWWNSTHVLAAIEGLPSAQPQLGTNLAEVGTDTISRQAAIDIAKELIITINGYEQHNQAVNNYSAKIMQLPPAQPEPCEDAVSRKAVLDAIDGWKWACANSGHKQTESDIKLIRKEFIELPPVTPKQHWIPVTERLPEEDDYRPCYGYEDGAVWWRNDMGLMGLGWYYPSYGKWAYYDESDRCDKCVGNVVEWMPLPKP